MSVSKKQSDTGWFYHAPSKTVPQEHQSVPPPSQIPGLSDVSQLPPDEQSKKMWIRDTDSDYVRLAKQGGRADLLRIRSGHRSPKPKAEVAKGYPRCDWFYQDDILAQENAIPDTKDPHEFMLPDYMVHQEYKGPKHGRRAMPLDGDGDPKQQKPFAYMHDQESPFQRQGDKNPTDKTVKLPEMRPSGYGVRAERASHRPTKHEPIQRTEPMRPRPSQMDEGKVKYQPVPTLEGGDPVPMGKLLSHGYVADWEESKNKWYDNQQRTKERMEAKSGPPPPGRTQTEYQEKMASVTKQANPAAGVKSRRNDDQNSVKSAKSVKHEDEDKELFKLSKFKGVPARTDSHRVPSGGPAQNNHHGTNPITFGREESDIPRSFQYSPQVAH